MENKMSKLAITITVGIILIGSLLVPVIQNADYGRTDYDNVVRPGTWHNMSNDVEDFEFTIQTGNVAYTDSDGTTDLPVLSRENFLFVSDKAIMVQTYLGSTYAHTAYGWFFNDTPEGIKIREAESDGAVVSFDADTMTLSYDKDTTHYSVEVEWIYHVDPKGEYRTMQTDREWYANTNDLIVAGGGYYVTGENDTVYSYFSFNKEEVIVAEMYEASIEITTTPVAESIEKCSIMIDIGGEEFKPWNVIIPIHVTSTENSDAEALLWAIPILLLVSLIVMTVRTATNKNN